MYVWHTAAYHHLYITPCSLVCMADMRRALITTCLLSTSSRSLSMSPPPACSPSLAAYEDLTSRLSIPILLQQTSALLHWDSMVTMPQTDAHHESRGAQSAALAGIVHEKSTDPAIGTLLDSIDPATLTEPQQANYRLMKKQFTLTSKIPQELSERRAKLEADAYVSWTKARASSNFSLFSPTLAKCFTTAVEIAKLKDPAADPYTTMLDEYEVGMSEGRIFDMFSTVRAELVPLIKQVLASPLAPATACIAGSFPLPQQKILNDKVTDWCGFKGRQDVSVHPFTTSFSASDVRITSRFDSAEFYQGLAGTVHETGHALYEGALGKEPLAVNAALSMGTHESQSLFWERHVGLSSQFWARWGQEARTTLGVDASDADLYGAVNAVKQSFIRVEADELTYPLHVILRTEIERDIVNGKMTVEQLPDVWNRKMKEMLDVDVPDDAKGCLQDVHWSGLAIGYFPTYLLGAICAAQLSHYIRLDLDVDSLVKEGDSAPIHAWLNDKVWRHGSAYESMDALLEAQLGERLNEKYFIEYLKSKYSDLYKL